MSGTKEVPVSSSSSKAVPKLHPSGGLLSPKTASGSPVKSSERDKSPHRLSPRGKRDTAEKGFSSMRSPRGSSKYSDNNRMITRDASELHSMAAEVRRLSFHAKRFLCFMFCCAVFLPLVYGYF